MATFHGVFYCVITHGKLRFCVSTFQKLRNSRRQLKFSGDKTFGDDELQQCLRNKINDKKWQFVISFVISYQKRVQGNVWQQSGRSTVSREDSPYSLSFQKKRQTKQKNANRWVFSWFKSEKQTKVLQPLSQTTERGLFCQRSTRLVWLFTRSLHGISNRLSLIDNLPPPRSNVNKSISS